MFSRSLLHIGRCPFCDQLKFLCACRDTSRAQEPGEARKDTSLTAYTITLKPDGSDEYVNTPGGV